MNLWTPQELRKALGEKAEKLGLRMPQVQTLLCQERFVARLAATDEGKNFVWKGGSLLLRSYPSLEQPRFTTDLDFLVQKMNFKDTEAVLQKAADIDLGDGFQFFDTQRKPMERPTPYGGNRYEIAWSLFEKGQSHPLLIDICTGDDVDPDQTTSTELFLVSSEQSFSLEIYPPEFIFAEKLETADRFFTGNTRFKDFVDMWSLLQWGLNDEKIKIAIKRCFSRRGKKFNPQRLLRLFNNEDFIQKMDEQKKKRFDVLNLPDTINIFETLKKYIHNLSI